MDELSSIKVFLDSYSATLQTIAYVFCASAFVIGVARKLPIGKRLSARRVLRKQLEQTVATIRESPALVRSGVSMSDLIETPSLWVEPSFRALTSRQGSPRAEDTLRYADFKRWLLGNPHGRRICIVGRAAIGKSTTIKRLFIESAERYSSGSLNVMPVYVDLSDRETLRSIENSSLDRYASHALFTNASLAGPRLLLIDGVDEALYSGEERAINKIISAKGEADGLVVCCRYSSYREYLLYKAGVTFNAQFYFEEYDPYALKEYANGLLRRLSDARDGSDASVSASIHEAIDRLMLRSPMHVAMAVETTHPAPKRIPTRLDSLAQVYGDFLMQLLERETSKPGCPITAPQLESIFKTIAGLLIARTPRGTLFRTPGAVIALEDLRRASEEVLGSSRLASASPSILDWIAIRSLFDSDSVDRVNTSWTFVHPSYCDYYVARFALDCLENYPAHSHDIFRVVIPQEIYEFMKYMLRDEALKSRWPKFVNNARQIAEEEEPKYRGGDNDSELCVEQVLHLVAHLRDEHAHSLAQETAQKYLSPFISRGVAIGLAFAGIRTDLEVYVQSLRDELLSDGFGRQNKLNLYHQLAYFGDTDIVHLRDFERLDLSNVEKTVSKLLAQTNSDLHRQTRLLDFYTIESLFYYGRIEKSLMPLLQEYVEPSRAVCERAISQQDTSTSEAARSLLGEVLRFTHPAQLILENTMKNATSVIKSTKASLAIDEAMALYPMTDASLSAAVDFVWVTLNGLHSRRVNNRSIKFYIVVAGALEVVLDSSEVQKLGPGDVCFVPPGVWCALKGVAAEIGIVCVPAFDPKDEEFS